MRGQADGPQRIPGIHGDEEFESSGGQGRRLNKVWWALLWLVVIVLAILPIPWW